MTAAGPRLVPGGPKVVAVGGGHGLAATLAAVRRYAGEVTAVVSVADDGGSTGRLREALSVPAPGDLRKCLVALGDASSVWPRALEHRFDRGELAGHALGNLVVAGLAQTVGDLVAALDELGRVVGAVGRVLPATVEPVVLRAARADGPDEVGQVAVERSGRIERVWLEPTDPPAPDAAVDAVLAADQIVLGPGSLYTSVLAALAVPGVAKAVAGSRAQRVYVCNLREQIPETEGYTVAAHVAALARHGVDVDVVLHQPGGLPRGDLAVPAVAADVADEGGAVHHPGRLAAALADLIG